MSTILDALTGDQALQLLRKLCAHDDTIRARVVAGAQEVLNAHCWEDTANDVRFDLESLSVEEIWDRAGAHRMGYTTPDEAACELVEEAVQPYVDEALRYQAAGLQEAAAQTRMGVLKGLYDFGHGAASEFKINAPDVAAGCFQGILEEWLRSKPGDDEQRAMEAFLSKECLDWVK